MYCINCGVELADSETVCPLCGTRVFHPDMPRQQGEPPFPPDPMGHPEEVNRSGVLFILTMLAVLPMWMNFLLRTYAWMSLLEDNGLINNMLAAVGLPRIHMINTAGAVVLGMVYNYIPYMILPIYSVLTKIDNSVIEAAQDLGANNRNVFLKVVLPMSMPGVISGVTMVFVPAVSTFIISKMLGGGGNLLIGDLIDMQFLGSAYNPNLGSAISLVLMVIILICMGIMNQFDDGENVGGGMIL